MKFIHLEKYCFFLGHARTGSTLLGAIIDQHPEGIISNELNSIKRVQEGASKDDLFIEIYQRSQKFQLKERQHTGYDYNFISNADSIDPSNIKVIGDKRSGASTHIIAQEPALVDKLRVLTELPLRVILTVRNPFDTIGTQFIKDENGNSLDEIVSRYFKTCDELLRLRSLFSKTEWLEVKNDVFIKDPINEIKQLFRHLDLTPNQKFLEQISSRLFKEPHLSREKISWNQNLIALIHENIQLYPFLQGYSFDN